jgi:hypothetical protein
VILLVAERKAGEANTGDPALSATEQREQLM